MFNKYTLYKSISYRIIITGVTVLFTGWHVALWLAIVGTFIYYIHEIIWERFK